MVARAAGSALVVMVEAVEDWPCDDTSAKRANEALAEGVHVGRAHGGANDAGAPALEGSRESGAELGVAVGDQHLGLLVQRGVASLLSAPVVGGRRGRRDVSKKNRARHGPPTE